MEPTNARIMYEACPLCESKDFAHLRNGECRNHPMWQECVGKLIHWQKCGACGHVFTDGYFTDEAAAKIFSRSNPHQSVGYEIEQQRRVSTRMVERILPYVNPDYGPKTWLDIGFGNGSLLFAAQEYGFCPIGLEARNNNVVDMMRLYNIPAYERSDVDLENSSINAVSMADVLEHVPFPRLLLAEVHRWLSPTGAILISMPNMDTQLWKYWDRTSKNPYWGEIEHYHNFGRRRLYALLQVCGFQPMSYGISERYRACMEVVAVKG